MEHLGDGDEGAPDGRPDRGGFVIESAPGTPGLIALVFPWEGRDAFEELMRRVRQVAPLIAITRDRGGGRVRLSRAGRPRIDYTVAAEDRETLRRGLVAAARLAHAGGSREMLAVGTPPAWFRGDGFDAYLDRLAGFDFAPNRGSVVSAHQMGSVRAGADPRDHAADPRGHVRLAGARAGADRVVGGLYVGDASAFPTALGVNPMIATMAWAKRVARTILAER
jgi:choline dehydrogenase-like flavoprotein